MTSSLNPLNYDNIPLRHAAYSNENISQTNRRLSDNKIREIESEYDKLTGHLSYNTLSTALELINSKREHRQKNYREAFNNFNPSPLSLLQKYHGGSPGSVAAAFKEKMNKMGLRTDIVGESRIITGEFFFPAPGNNTPAGTPLIWEQAKSGLDEITNYLLVLPYSDYWDNLRLILFKKYFTGEDNIKKYRDITALKEEILRRNGKPLKLIADDSEAIKSSMRIRFRYFVVHKENKETLAINLLDGTLSIIPGNIKGIVKNMKGRIKFDLADMLEHPEQKTQTLLNGQPQELSKGELVGFLLKQIRNSFHFPEDFAENLSVLMKEREQFIKETMVEPATAIFDSWESYRKADFARQEAEYVQSGTDLKKDSEPNRLYRQGKNNFLLAVRALQKGDKNSAIHLFSEAFRQFKNCSQMCGDIQKVPLAIITEDFRYL